MTIFNKRLYVVAFAAAMQWISSGAMAQVSPNGKIKVEAKKGELVVMYKQGKAWTQVMSMPTECTVASKPERINVEYDMLVGKKLHCTNACNYSVYTKKGDSKTLHVKVYDDGVAWSGEKSYTTDFTTAQNYWLMKWADSYEDFFPKNRELKKGERYGYPALFEYGKDVFALLSESNMNETLAASSMHAIDDNGALKLSLRPDGPENGGWQTLIVGSLADVVESTLITDNSEPCRLTDTSWIKPGVASWVYWAYNHGSNDYNILKMYTDFAVEMQLPYVLIDAEWDDMPKLESNQGKTIEDAVKYAIDRGVKPMIWYNSSVGWINGAPTPKFRLNKPEDREKEFAWCESIGVKGVKIDFFSGDNNMNISYMKELLECAAKHHLLVNFHGATTMRGWQRTYPNLISTEAVYGAEWYNNVPTFTKRAAAHNATLPFTRNVIGSMDYTPCAFTDSQHPHITTHAHELALTVLYESGVQHLADRPESFLAQPLEVKQFISNLPTVWDETRYISGYPGESAVLARRSGNTWYVAGINGTDEVKELSVAGIEKLCKSTTKDITFKIFNDNEEETKAQFGDGPWRIWTFGSKVGIPTKVKCQPRGGFIIKFCL